MQLRQRLPVLGAVGELLRRDDVVDRGEAHDERADLVANRPFGELVVSVSTTGPVAQLGQDVERTGVGHPRRGPEAVHVLASMRTIRRWASSSLQPADAQSGVQVAQCVGEAVEFSIVVDGRQSTSAVRRCAP